MRNPFDEPTQTSLGPRYREGMVMFGGAFELERQLGRGGMGEVWLARDLRLGGQRALKFLPSEVAGDPVALNRLRREAKAGQSLSHPRIVRTYDFHNEAGHAAVSMEYVPGLTLSQQLGTRERGYFEVADIAGWIKDICEALQYAHGEGRVIHRDLKPANVMIEKAGGRAKVMDFGIARRIAETHTQMTGKDPGGGTVAYSSPQQLDGEKGTAADDIYSLGVTIYELLTGAPPFFRGKLDDQVRNKVPPSMTDRRAELVDEGQVEGGGDEIPGLWERGVAWCLQKDEAKRPPDAASLWQWFSGETRQQEEQRARREAAAKLEQQRQAEEERRRRETQRKPAETSIPFVSSVPSVLSAMAKKTAKPKGLGVWMGIAGIVLLAGMTWALLWAAPWVLHSKKEASNIPDHSEVEVTPRKAEPPRPTAPAPPEPAPKVTPAEVKGFSLIPAGEFTMGDALDGDKRAPPHKVYVSAFYMQKTEVTKAQWDEVREWGLKHGYTDLPSGSGKAEDHPVFNISWYDVVKWCNAKSEKEGLVPCYYTDDAQKNTYRTGETTNISNIIISNTKVKWNVNGYRLPTEAEWEKAARGGLSGKRFPWGDTISHAQANFYNSGKESYQTGTAGFHPTYITGEMTPYTSPVGSFPANDYGLYDMAGNIEEMCWDVDGKDYYASSPSRDPRGKAWGTSRVTGGGSWHDDAICCRVAYRYGCSRPNYMDGFRVARSSVP